MKKRNAAPKNKNNSQLVDSAKKAVSLVWDNLKNQELPKDEFLKIEESIMSLFISLMKIDGEISDSELEMVTGYFKENYGHESTNRFRSLIHKKSITSVEQACIEIKKFQLFEKEELILALLNVAMADGSYGEAEKELMKEIIKFLDLEDDYLQKAEQKIVKSQKSHQSLLKSSAGLISALVIIIIFILTATYLKAVFFGLILAYIFLPLQQWYARSFFQNGIVARCVKFITLVKNLLLLPLRKIKSICTVKSTLPKSEDKISAEELQQKAILNRSCYATFVTVIFAAVTFVILLIMLLTNYYTKAKDGFEHDKELSEANKKSILENFLERINPDLMNIPVVEKSVKKVQEFFDDDQKMAEFKAKFLDNYDNIGSWLISSLGGLVGILLNVFLSLFFFTFFLAKMAEFQIKTNGKKSIGDYLVGSIFDSSWLPNTSEDTRKSAAEIIDVITLKLRTWVRGYLWIIMIESTIYSLAFMAMGIDYALILGMIAGSTVLLPFLGPIASILLTITVCVLTGNMSAAILVAILLLYAFMNMVIEQFFLYPAFVGEALGLNILETIAVVLLGGLVAGLTGVIFAVPTASILKYLIPKIYSTVARNPVEVNKG